MNTVFIYALNDPETGKTRYIGAALRGKPKSPEHIAAARLGRILSQERKAKVGYL